VSVSPAAFDLDEALAHYREHGFARLGVVADEPRLEALRRRAEEIMLGAVRHEGMFFQHDTETGRYEDLRFGKGWEGPSLNYRKLEKLEKDPLFRAWIDNPTFEQVARALIDGDVVIYRAVLFNKAAAGGTVLPWHQDGGSYWGLDRDPGLQIWTAIDDAPEGGGCLEVLPGSHRDGLATPLGGMIPRALVDARQADQHKVLLPARPGEVILVHNHLWHGSAVNRSGRTRRGLSICYMSAATRCLRKKRAPRAFTPVFGSRRVD
jgi:ectoine hydroxylase-related dioxygenase (phytanoyl-CoA dioxygenase family)